MKAILLAGGLGTRLREETDVRPKPMVEIGGRPMLWHIMKGLAVYGITEFIIATGYKSDIIKDYFLNIRAWNSDITVTLSDGHAIEFHDRANEQEWSVTITFTGESTMTGGRVFRAAKYLDSQPFLVTYGDGLADVDINALRRQHSESGRLVTVTAVRPPSRFGLMDITDDGLVRSFVEKPLLDDWVNAGFMIMEPQALDYLDPECILEQEPLIQLAKNGQLGAYRHSGFWQPMDTYREFLLLNQLWSTGEAPWKTWN